MNTPSAIVLGAVLIACSILGAQFVPRYQAGMVTGASTFWRLNVATGAIEVCAFERDAGAPGSRQTVHCHGEFP